MGIVGQIQADLTQAMKSKDELRLSALRMVKSALKLKEVEKIRPLEDAEVLQILQTLIKQRRESIEMFTRGGRQELAAKEQKEILVIESYLPSAPSDAEMDPAVEGAVTRKWTKPLSAR